MSRPLPFMRPAAQGFAVTLLVALAGCGLSSREAAKSSEPVPVAPSVVPQGEIAEVRQATVKRMLMKPASMPAPNVANDAIAAGYRAEPREQYEKLPDNPIHSVAETPVSTFSVDVDTGSYANVRRLLNQGSLPPKVPCGWRKWSIILRIATPCPLTVHPSA